jgi:hypothetical protein
LSIRKFERQLGILSGLARRWPDPRSEAFVTYSAEQVLTQLVYQVLAGYADSNDANPLRHDSLCQTLLDLPAGGADRHLVNGATVARFHYVYTRRQHDLPAAEQPAFFSNARRAWSESSCSTILGGAVRTHAA